MSGRRTDNNHAEIRDGLRAAGWTVEDTSAFGHGFPDLLVGIDGTFVLFEVKSKGGELNERELRFHAKFCESPIYVVYTLEEALSRLRRLWDER